MTTEKLEQTDMGALTEQDLESKVSELDSEIAELELAIPALVDRLDRGCAVIGELETTNQTGGDKYQRAFALWQSLLTDYEQKSDRLKALKTQKRGWAKLMTDNFYKQAS